MNKNDIIELQITDMGVDGEGIGKYEGMTFFVKDALVGDRIKARIVKLKKHYGYARLEEILEPSASRIEPPCPLHRRCGGCQIQAMNYQAQLAYKQNKVENNLKRLGGFSDEEVASVMQPILGAEQPFRYRNKAQFPVGYDKEGNIIMGFYASRTHSIIPVQDCLLGVEENAPILELIRKWMESYGVPAYQETDGTGLVRHILIRYGFTTHEIMVCLVINGTALPHQDELLEALRGVEGMTSISININRERTNVILGKETRCIWGMPYITDYIQNVAFHISPQSFYQVNPKQTEVLYGKALEYAQLQGEESVWDLYCGIGTISLFLAQKAKKVYGVEIVPQAIEDAKRNAALNQLTNTEFFVGKAEEVLPAFYEEHAGSDMTHPDVIVVDPPRKGCDGACLSTMLAMKPERIVYVSCDSATLARDLRILVDGGYELEKVQPVDQFPNSVHVETVCLLSNTQKKKESYVTLDVEMDDYYRIKGEGKSTK